LGLEGTRECFRQEVSRGMQSSRDR